MVVRSRVVVFEAHCCLCYKVIGQLDRDEFYNHVMGSGLCFDCDPESAATTPNIFWQWQDGDYFSIADQGLEVVNGVLTVKDSALPRAHASMRAPGLSSSTKVNTNEHNVALFVDGVERKVCPKCDGVGFLRTLNEDFGCDICDGDGMIDTAIILPTWILGLGCENE